MVNRELLREIIAESGYKQKALAEMIGTSPYAFVGKMNNTRDFNLREVKALCELLDIKDPAKIVAIFLA